MGQIPRSTERILVLVYLIICLFFYLMLVLTFLKSHCESVRLIIRPTALKERRDSAVVTSGAEQGRGELKWYFVEIPHKFVGRVVYAR